jgi:hypothetical protein
MPLHHANYVIGTNNDDYDVSFRRQKGEYVPVSAPPRQMYWNRNPDYNRLKIPSLTNITSELLFRRDIAPGDEDHLFNEKRAKLFCITSTSLKWIKVSTHLRAG